MPVSFFPDDMTISGCRRNYSGEDDSPADYIVSRQLDDPFVAAEFDEMARQAELLGIDLSDPEIMGAWLKNIINKVKARIKKRRAARGGGGGGGIQVTTDAGTASIGPGGLSFTQTPSGPVPGSMMSPPSGGGISEMLKNPMVLAAGVGLLALLAMRKR